MTQPEFPDDVKTAEEAGEDNYRTNQNGGGDGLITGQGLSGAWEESSFKEDFDKAWDAAAGLISGDASVVEAAGEIQSFVSGLPIAGLIADPLHTLLTFGLGFLIDVIKPLDDVLKLVTGDEEELKNAAEEFGEVSKAPQAMYRLAASPRSSSPSGDYLTDTGNRSRKSKKQSKDCYTLNVREGDCLTLAKVGEFTLYQRVACGLSPNKVTKVVAGKADERLCTTGDDSYVYSQPASTVCISKV